MKAIYIYICLSIWGIHSLYSQIGILTENPQALFHIDAGTIATTTDDVVITNQGRLGVGTVAPTERLHINGSFTFNEGGAHAPTEGMMLRSADNLGNAHWAVVQARMIEAANVHTTLNSAAQNRLTAAPIYKGISITLPPGFWQISFSASYLNNIPVATSMIGASRAVNCFFDLSTSDVTNNRVGGRLVSTPAKRGANMTSAGYYLVNIATSTTYYLWSFVTGVTSFNATTDIVSYNGTNTNQARLFAIELSR